MDKNLIKSDFIKAGPFWAPPMGQVYEHVLLHGSTDLSFNWYEDALDFDVYNSKSIRLRLMVNDLYAEISKEIKIQSSTRAKEAIKNVLINLWHSRLMDKPVRYSRDRNRYVRHRRYAKLFLKYDRLIPIIDTLDTLGYIQQKEGRFIYDKGFGRQTRMWGTYKLWNKFNNYGLMLTQTFFTTPEPEELIILNKTVIEKRKNKKDKKYKVQIGYTDTKQTKQWREDLIRYNDFINKQDISVRLEGSVVVDNYFLINYLYHNINNHSIQIEAVSVSNNSVIQQNNSFSTLNYTPTIIKLPPPYNSQSLYPNNTIRLLQTQTTMTQMKHPERLMGLSFHKPAQKGKFLYGYIFEVCSSVADASTFAQKQAILKEEYRLEDIGVHELVFKLNKEYLHRVFNRGAFKYGGRAYGALHQNLPRHMRPFIFINGSPTIEIDYSAYHIRMLYHLEGIEYTEDPYLVCGGVDMREIYKSVALVAINARDTKTACGGIRDELDGKGIPLPKINKPLVSLINTFKVSHLPIEKYLFSDMGATLMNYDGGIMNHILMRLTDKGIPALSVHDSVIIAEHHADFLREVMVKEYETIMKFKPMF